MNRSIIKRLSIYGIVLLFSFFAFGCGTKEAAQQGSDIQQEESLVEVKESLRLKRSKYYEDTCAERKSPV